MGKEITIVDQNPHTHYSLLSWGSAFSNVYSSDNILSAGSHYLRRHD